MGEQSDRFKIDLNNGTGTVYVGDVDIASMTTGLDITIRPGRPAEVVAHLKVHETLVNGEAVVSVPQVTRDALVALGWKPPGGEDAALLAVAEDRVRRDNGVRHPLDNVLAEET